MKAVGYKKSLPIETADALIDFETAKPRAEDATSAVAVKQSGQPVDYKVATGRAAGRRDQDLGYDSRRRGRAVGPTSPSSRSATKCFTPARSSARAQFEFHLVDERIVGASRNRFRRAGRSAAVDSITAWEFAVDRLAVPAKSVDPRTLLITAARRCRLDPDQLARGHGADGVATANRPESQKWCLDLGAHAVIDHSSR